MRLLEYKIIAGGNQATFEGDMQRAIQDGFEPYGELKIEQPTNNFHGFFQAVVKYYRKEPCACKTCSGQCACGVAGHHNYSSKEEALPIPLADEQEYQEAKRLVNAIFPEILPKGWFPARIREILEGVNPAVNWSTAIPAIQLVALKIIGEDSPLEPSADAVGDLEIDPLKWREWSIVENRLRDQLRQRVKG